MSRSDASYQIDFPPPSDNGLGLPDLSANQFLLFLSFGVPLFWLLTESIDVIKRPLNFAYRRL